MTWYANPVPVLLLRSTLCAMIPRHHPSRSQCRLHSRTPHRSHNQMGVPHVAQDTGAAVPRQSHAFQALRPEKHGG